MRLKSCYALTRGWWVFSLKNYDVKCAFHFCTNANTVERHVTWNKCLFNIIMSVNGFLPCSGEVGRPDGRTQQSWPDHHHHRHRGLSTYCTSIFSGFGQLNRIKILIILNLTVLERTLTWTVGLGLLLGIKSFLTCDYQPVVCTSMCLSDLLQLSSRLLYFLVPYPIKYQVRWTSVILINHSAIIYLCGRRLTRLLA